MAAVQNMPQSTAETLKKAPLPLKLGGLLVTALSSDGSRPDRMRLVSISISHYVEKVRWALDTLCIARNDDTLYTEDGHLPGMHANFSVPASGGIASMTPMLITRREGENAILWDSTRILEWLCNEYEELSFLYPADIREEVLALEEDLGVPIRRFAYSIILQYPDLAKSIIASELTFIERLAFPAVLPILKQKLAKLLSIDFSPESNTKDEALTQIVHVFDRIAERLADGRKYLTGDRFTAADIAFASLCYPVVAALDRETWAVRMPAPECFPPEYTARLASLIEHPAGQFAARIYKEHRHATPPPAPGAKPTRIVSKPVGIHWNNTASYVPTIVTATLFVTVSACVLGAFCHKA